MLALGCAQRGLAAPRHLLRRWRFTFVGGAGAVLAYAIALWAMTQAPVALVAALRETSVVFAALIDHYGLFWSEVRAFDLTRTGGLLLVLAGTWLVVR